MIRIIYGKRGYGKSTLAQKLYRYYSNSTKKRVIYYTPFEDDIPFLSLVSNPDEYNRINPRSAVFVGAPDLLTQIDLHNVILILDEADNVADNINIDGLIKYGRHANISMILVARRPFEISPLLRSQLDYLDTFAISEKRDVDYLANITTKEFAERAQKLKRFTYLQYDYDSGKTVKYRLT